jgi:hypothetical protein
VNQVFVFEVEDARASTWISEIAIVADSRSTALTFLKHAGVHKKQIAGHSRPTRVESLSAFGDLDDVPGAMIRRRLDDDGWTDWSVVSESDPANWKDRQSENED